ncbi:MAG: hypothetical protein ACI85K_003569 [Hyphomicrobiaceae bacterium]|jgi:hypothetical protein
MLLTLDFDALLAVFGRFHIIFLHLPIGLLPGIALLEFGAAIIRKPIPRGAVLTLTVMTALVAGAALASGLVLAGEKVNSDLLGEHKLAAIAMTVVCALLPIFAAFKSRKVFRIVLLVAMGLSVYAGHLGGSLVHKKDFLFKPLERAARLAKAAENGVQGTVSDAGAGGVPGAGSIPGAGTVPDPDAGTVPVIGNPATPPATKTHFELVIAPIFARACADCHNPDDFEGDLDLTTKDGILGLDRDEPDRMLVPGKPEMSILIELCELPLDDEDHMPPIDEDEPDAVQQLTKKELAALRAWILAGCKFD